MAQRLKSLLSNNQELRPLLTKAQALSALERHFMGVAPPHLAQSVQVLSLQLGTLCIAATNAAIAAKLRQLAPELVVMLQNRGCEINGIRIKVQVSVSDARAKPATRKLSETAQSVLNDFSQGLGESPLKLALKKMIGAKN